MQRVHTLDTLLFLWLHVTKQFQCRRFVKLISKSGDGVWYLLIALALVIFETHSGQAFFIAASVAYALDVSLYLILKNVIKRDRPSQSLGYYQAWITPSDTFSFPSGHTAAAFVFACLVAHYYPGFALFCFIWASLIGASRVLLGVHYPSDIVAGALLGSSCAFMGMQCNLLQGAL